LFSLEKINVDREVVLFPSSVYFLVSRYANAVRKKERRKERKKEESKLRKKKVN
jgi:hypothetical protein